MQDSIIKNKDLIQDMDIAYKMQLNILAKVHLNLTGYILPASLTTWSRYYFHQHSGFIFPIPEFSKKTELRDLIENLSEKYWNYKGFYNAG